LDVPSVAVDLASIVGQLVCSGLQNLGDDKRPFPGRGKLVAPSGVLSQSKYQVSNLEASGVTSQSYFGNLIKLSKSFELKYLLITLLLFLKLHLIKQEEVLIKI
jgi:hypothetical protein